MPRRAHAEGRRQYTQAQNWARVQVTRKTRKGDVYTKFKIRATPKAPPPWHRVKEVNWLEGGTMNRIKVLKISPPAARGKPPILGARAWVLAKFPTPHMLAIGCDRCSGPHRPKNTACSANLGIPTPMDEPQSMYNFTTGEQLEEVWKLQQEDAMPRAKVTERIYVRVR